MKTNSEITLLQLAFFKLEWICIITSNTWCCIFFTVADPCSTKECPKGTICRVFSYTGEAFCDPSCSVDNGGCGDDQLCILALPACAFPPVQPCIGFVVCVDIGMGNVKRIIVHCVEIHVLKSSLVNLVHDNVTTVINHLHLFLSVSFNFSSLDPCSLIDCPVGSACKVFEETGEGFCEPSCELQNGGCAKDQTCELMDVTCVREPCPLVVVCQDNRETACWSYVILIVPFCHQHNVNKSFQLCLFTSKLH